MNWKKGEQKGDYDVAKLLTLGIFNVNLIRARKGQEIGEHKNVAWLGHRYQAIFILKEAEEGGEFVVSGKSKVSMRRFKLFCSTRQWHYLSPVDKGEVLMLSLSWLTKGKKRG